MPNQFTTKPSPSPPPVRQRIGEAAGGAAAVCCCCPCVVIEFLVLAVYKFPSILCRRIKKRRRSMKGKRGKGLLQGAGESREGETGGTIVAVDEEDGVKMRSSWDDVVDLDEEMWARFRDAGFWRSPSQRG